MEQTVYEVKDVMELLNISRNCAYRFVQKTYKEKGPFPVLKIGTAYRIPKKPFDIWLGMM